jgi:hypothetical protein
MTILNVTSLLDDLEINENRALAIKTILDGEFSLDLLKKSVEELCDHAESIKLGYSAFEDIPKPV